MPGGVIQLKAIRGAVCVPDNTAEAIEHAARELVEAVARENRLTAVQVVSAFFTATPDLDAQFPAVGARQAGWTDVPLMCAQEMAVARSLPRCIRLLVHAYLPVDLRPRHVYLGEAARLRPDWHAPAAAPEQVAAGEKGA